MKTKEELLKIYSAYLPYELNVRCDKETYLQPDDERIGQLRCIDLEQNYEAVIYGDNGYYLCDLVDLKPILYSMDMLTKEIEGGKFIPIIELKRIFPNAPAFDEWIKYYIDNISLMESKVEYCVIAKLIEWHFNVFGLHESEYIKKETL